MWAPPSLESLTLHPPKIKKQLVCGTKMQILQNSPFYISGDTIHGRLVLDLSPHTYVGNVCLALRGEEEIMYPLLQTRDPFLHSFALIQDALATPINNITGIRHWSYTGYRKSIPGKIIIPFNFILPSDLPSTNAFKKVCAVRYSIVAIAEVLRFTDPKLLIKEVPVLIMENFEDFHHSFFTKPVEAHLSKQIVLNPGLVHLSACIERRGMNSYSKNYIKVHVRNSTLKKVHGIEIQVIKKCTIPYLPGFVLPQDDFSTDSFDLTNPEELIKTQIVWRKKFFGSKATFDSGEFRSEVFEYYCPEDCITGRLTSLFYVSIFVKVKLHVGILTSPLDVELPIVVRPFGAAYHPPNIQFDEHIHPHHFNHLYLSVKGKEKRDWMSTFLTNNSTNGDDSNDSSENGENNNQAAYLNTSADRSDRIPWNTEMEDVLDMNKFHSIHFKYGKQLFAKFKNLKLKASRADLSFKPFIIYEKTKKDNVYYGFQPQDVNLWEYRLTSNLPALQKKKIIFKGNAPTNIHPKIYFNSDDRCKRSFFGWYFGTTPVFNDRNDKDEDLKSEKTNVSDYYGGGWWYQLPDQHKEEFVIPTILEPSEHSLKTKPSWGDWLKDSMQNKPRQRVGIPKEWQQQ